MTPRPASLDGTDAKEWGAGQLAALRHAPPNIKERPTGWPDGRRQLAARGLGRQEGLGIYSEEKMKKIS